tara:strand:+ start:140 stop:349 length:210 start_codon:yes stop_codon:yes gene_type:complete
VGIGEANAVFGQLVNVWCVDFAPFASVAPHIADTKIVGQDEHHVGSLGSESRQGKQCREKQTEEAYHKL